MQEHHGVTELRDGSLDPSSWARGWLQADRTSMAEASKEKPAQRDSSAAQELRGHLVLRTENGPNVRAWSIFKIFSSNLQAH